MDSEKTLEEVGVTSPLNKDEIIRALPDDAEVDARQGEREQPLIPTRSRSSLVPRVAATVLTPPEATSIPPAALSSSLEIRAPIFRAPQLSGFKLPEWKVEYVAMDW